ncbi:MAG: hypothetical protein ISS56_17885 [Anaerolineae bacterium]|nr:hypothetical protein [Anaerolineae bacterium]
MNQKRTPHLGAALLLLLILAAGCGLPAETPTPIPPTPSGASAFPTGTFAMEDLNGKWLMDLKQDGSFTLTLNGTPMVQRGAYTVVEDQITISDDSAPCVGNDGPGTYRWTYDGRVLTWKVVQDPCPKRRGTQHGSQWTIGSE